jgi:prophage regulatory protein
MSYPKIVRRAEVLNLLKISRSNLYQKNQKGLWPAPIPLGARAVGWISSENENVLAAMISGQDQDQIKLLVRDLLKQRENVFMGYRR